MKNKKVIIALSIIVGIGLLSLIRYFVVVKKTNDKADANKQISVYTIPERKKIYIEGELQSINKEVFDFDATKGEISKINVKDKQKVKKGDVLFTYKNETLIDQQKELEYQLDTLKTTYKKMEKGVGSSTNQDVNNLSLQNQYTGDMKEQLNDNKKQQEKIKNQISDLKDKAYTNIKASFNGTVLRNDNSKSPVLTVVDSKMHVVCNVSEKEILDLAVDQGVNVKIYATGQEVKGKITYIGTETKADTQLSEMQLGGMESAQANVNYYPVHIDLEEQLDIYSGFHTQVSAEAKNELPKIPKKAIFNENGVNYVWVVKNDVVNKRQISFVDWNDKYVKVNEGVTFKDKILREAMDTIKEGDNIGSNSNTN